jgi:tetratricopeptide (TPR) repeat protein
LTQHNKAAVAEICRRLNGVPLAIELAAARVNVLTPQQIAARLDDRFGLLIAGSRMAPRRQQTLRATMDWSYDLLTPLEQTVFDRLSVFSGGWTLDAAEQVCDGGELAAGQIVDLLSRLVDKSLVVAEERRGELRYRLLETILLYAHRRLSEKPVKALEAQRRHIVYFLTLAEQAGSQLREGNQLLWLDRLQLEHDNLRAALRRSLEGSDADAALRLSSALWYFWQVRGHVREAHDWLERALQQGNVDGTPILAKALRAAGAMSGFLGNQRLAQARFTQALSIYEGLADRVGIAATLNNLAVTETELGEYSEAERLLERCLMLRHDTDQSGLALVLGNLAWVAEAQGQFEKAIGWHQQALAIWRAIDHREGAAASLIWQAGVLQCTGDHKTARTLVEEGLTLARALDSRPRITRGLRILGAIDLEYREPERAAVLLCESLRVALEGGLEREAASCLTWLA